MKGTGVSPGISIGSARWVVRQRLAPTGILIDGPEAIRAEVEKFRAAVTSAVAEVEALINTSTPGISAEPAATPPQSAEAGVPALPAEPAALPTPSTEPAVPAQSAEAAAILETHIAMLTDPELEQEVLEKIEGGKKNAVDAVYEVVSRLAEMFRHMEDAYLRERAADIEDVGQRLLRHLAGTATPTLTGSAAPTLDGSTADSPQSPDGPPTATPFILLAEDLTPSETIMMDLSEVSGIALIAGGKTSHAAILARMKGLPAIVGCGEALRQIKDDDELILDGGTGEIHIHPNPTLLAEFQQKKTAHTTRTRLLAALRHRPATTTDGTDIHLYANISKTEDMQDVFHHGGEGVGLFRTEFLYMERNAFPTEEEQFQYYRDLALRCGSHPLVIRTLDIGGDKPLPYFPLPKEDNPFLGYRAIRISLDRTDIFLAQLKAILRAGVFGNIRILLPMIGDVMQLREAKALLEEARRQLQEQSIPYSTDIPLGIMIEVPSAALTADLLAKEADFFSIGTNDLCQYVLAADRLNQHIGNLYDPYHPALLRLIDTVIQQGHRHHIPVSLCGEMAADPLATLLLAGMGLTALSMNASSIPVVKNIIINHSLEKAKNIHRTVMGLSHSADIIQYLQEVNT